MPKLLAFLPCERVIVERGDNSVTLVSLVQSFKITAASPAQQLPTEEEPLSFPMRWSVFTLWFKTQEDEGVTYEQKAELLSPAGKILVSQASEFAMFKDYHRVTGGVFGFPLTGAGNYLLRLSLRSTASADFGVVQEFPMRIILAKETAQVQAPQEHQSDNV